jgi:hypothetical protein
LLGPGRGARTVPFTATLSYFYILTCANIPRPPRRPTGPGIQRHEAPRDAHLCQHTGTIQVHQIRTLADLAQPGPTAPTWKTLMANKRRKTLVVCDACHQQIHTTQATPTHT